MRQQGKTGFKLAFGYIFEQFDESGNATYTMEKGAETKEITEEEYYTTFEKYSDATIVGFSYGASDAGKADINFMFLLEGAPVPDHAAFARFRSVHFAPCAKCILAEMSDALFDLGEISGETVSIDGTKIEADANKYTFV